jgi:hypothetical protein
MGYSELKDLQNLDANNATERWLKYIGPNGRRQDAAHRYVHNKLQSGDYPNLHVVCEKQVIRVLFDDDKKAVGVEYQSNPKFRKCPDGKFLTVLDIWRLIAHLPPSAEPRIHDGQSNTTYSQSQEDGRSVCRCKRHSTRPRALRCRPEGDLRESRCPTRRGARWCRT